MIWKTKPKQPKQPKTSTHMLLDVDKMYVTILSDRGKEYVTEVIGQWRFYYEGHRLEDRQIQILKPTLSSFLENRDKSGLLVLSDTEAIGIHTIQDIQVRHESHMEEIQCDGNETVHYVKRFYW